MKHFLILTAAAAMLAAWAPTDASAGCCYGPIRSRMAYYQTPWAPWHGESYDAAWGRTGGH